MWDAGNASHQELHREGWLASVLSPEKPKRVVQPRVMSEEEIERRYREALYDMEGTNEMETKQPVLVVIEVADGLITSRNRPAHIDLLIVNWDDMKDAHGVDAIETLKRRLDELDSFNARNGTQVHQDMRTILQEAIMEEAKKLAGLP